MVSKLLNFWTTGTIIFLKGPNHKHLTSADPLQSGGAGAEVAFQPLGVVAGLHFAAVLVELLGADLAAATAVPDQPDARGALGRLQGAVAGGGAGERLEGGEDSRETRRGEQEGRPGKGRGSPTRSAGSPRAGLRRPGGPRHLFKGKLKERGTRNVPELFSFSFSVPWAAWGEDEGL